MIKYPNIVATDLPFSVYFSFELHKDNYDYVARLWVNKENGEMSFRIFDMKDIDRNNISTIMSGLNALTGIYTQLEKFPDHLNALVKLYERE